MLSERYYSALKFATKMHSGQYRVGGAEYITHPIAVAEMLKGENLGEDYLITALFHDLLEDTSATEQEILNIGGESVLNAVKLLTKDKNYNMQSYIENIKKNPIAFKVKCADRLHNLTCAHIQKDSFKHKYIKESLEWYLDFSPEILPAIQSLAKTIDEDIDKLNKQYPKLNLKNVKN